METNPYQPPTAEAAIADTPAKIVPLALRIPAVALSVLGVVSVVCYGSGIVGVGIVLLLLSPEARRPPTEVLLITVGYGAMLISSVAVVYGAHHARQMRSYRWSMAAAILAMIPYFSPLAYLGIPFGIWMFIVLLRKDVRKRFASPATAS